MFLPNDHQEKRTVPSIFWDINLGEMFDRPPWEVREKVTVSDVSRMRIWNEYRKFGRDTSTEFAKGKAAMDTRMKRA